jgi:hypothetical protein
MPVGGVWSTWEFAKRWQDRGLYAVHRLGIRRVFHEAMFEFPDDNEPKGGVPPVNAQSN